MRLGELPQHPDYNILIDKAEKDLDVCTARVVVASRKEDLGEIRYWVGYRKHAEDMLERLLEAKRKVG